MNNSMEIPKVFLEVVSLCAFFVFLDYFMLIRFSPFLKNKTTGRDKEIKYFMCTMKEFLVSNCSRILMYEGLSGYGKSQILMEIEYLAQGENHR